MKKQYKECKVIDKDLSEFLLYDEKISDSFNEIEIEPKKPRGGASKGKFGGSKQIVLPME